MSTVEAAAAAVDDMAARFSGEVLRPEDPGYDEARRCHNGLIDRYPALIARCRGTADVIDALALARELGLEVAVRGGGHNAAGRCISEGGVMIDLATMRGIRVDPAARTVHVQGGVTWGELNRETAVHGLAVTGGVISSTGVAGLTLGGGLGWLMARHGLAADNLVGAELVTADGRVLQVDEGEHAELLWALCGGGGNFGVVTKFELRLHPCATVTGGLIAHPFEAAPQMLRFYRDVTASAPDDLSVFAGLVHAPDGSGAPIAAMVACHTGTEAEAARDLEPILGFGQPIMTQVGPMPYPAINTMLDPAYPRGALNYWKSSFLRELDDAFIERAVDQFALCPSPMTALLLEHFHGAVARVPMSDSPFPFRQTGYNTVITGQWSDPADTDANVAWTRQTFDALAPSFADVRYVNYLSDDDETPWAGGDATSDRLRAVKRRYDPDNVFRANHNVKPG